MKKIIYGIFFGSICFFAGMITDYCRFYKDYEAICFFGDAIRSIGDADPSFDEMYGDIVENTDYSGFYSLKKEDMKEYSKCSYSY